MTGTRRVAGILGVALTAVIAPAVARAATIEVNTTGDDPGSICADVSGPQPGPCTLRAAVIASSSGDEISLDPANLSPPQTSAVYTLTQTAAGGGLPSATLAIPGEQLRITGTGARSVTIAQREDSVAQDEPEGVLHILPGATVTISGVTLTGGNIVAQADPSDDAFPAEGGAIENHGDLTLKNSTVTANTVTGGCVHGVEEGAIGGGIWNAGTLTLVGDTISGNSAREDLPGVSPPALADPCSALGQGGRPAGGGVANVVAGTVTAVNTTIADNDASADPGYLFDGGGGGLYTQGDAVTLGNVTLADNTATGTGLGIPPLNGANLELDGGGVTVGNSIIAGGGAQAGETNCAGDAAPASTGYNITDDPAGSRCELGALGDQNVAPGSLSQPLADNGGPTDTIRLQQGSAPVDGGNPAGCADPLGSGSLATDERGLIRPAPSGARCDSGAFELAPPVATTGSAGSVTTSGATIAGTVDPDQLDTSWHVEYGTTTAYGASTAAEQVSAGTSVSAVSSQLSGLQPATVYHYRVVATSGEGTSSGTDGTFTTAATSHPPPPPPPPPPKTRPVLSRLHVSPRRFAGRAGVVAGKRPLPRRATLSYLDSAAARTTLTIEQLRPGERVHGRCVAATRTRSHRGPACRRAVARLKLVHRDTAAKLVKIPLSAHTHGKRLGAGTYRVVAIAKTSGGLSSASVSTTFVIVR